jgi:N-acetylneuraminic acid mutarotase
MNAALSSLGDVEEFNMPVMTRNVVFRPRKSHPLACFAVVLAACGADQHFAADPQPSAESTSLDARESRPLEAPALQAVAPRSEAPEPAPNEAVQDAIAMDPPEIAPPNQAAEDRASEPAMRAPAPAPEVKPPGHTAECLSPMPVHSRGNAVVARNNAFYTFGGVSEKEGEAGVPHSEDEAELIATTFYKTVRFYEPALERWSTKASMPTGLYVLTAHALGEKIYTFGGYNAGGFNSSVQAYDPTTDSWTQSPAMPSLRYTFASEVVNGKAYVIGGQGPNPNNYEEWPYTDKVEIFDPATGWTSGAPSPQPTAAAASCALGDRIFVFGGDVNNLTSIYDVSTNSWSLGAPPPTARNAHTCVRVGDAFFLLGGRDGSGSLDVVEKYTPATDTWQQHGHMAMARNWFGAAALEDKIYVFGGAGEGSVPDDGLLDCVEVIDASGK